MEKLDLLIVTGATRGIGNAIVVNCASVAKKIIAIGSSTPPNNITCFSSCSAINLDIGNIELIKASLCKFVGEGKFKKIGVALCASQIGDPGGIFDTHIEDWSMLYKVNVLGNLEVLKFATERMDNDASLRAIFFAGGGAAYGYPEFSGYAITKVATVRAVENVGLEFTKRMLNASIIALAPGAVATDMLAKVIANGGGIKTKTDMSEPVTFVRRFLLDEFPSTALNGRFIHVRDDLERINSEGFTDSHFKLRRVE